MVYDINLVPASIEDAEKITVLINLSYRGKEGWTKETEIVAGERINLAGVKLLIQKENSNMFIATIDEALVACVCIEQEGNKAYIGSFAVAPAFQNMGIGKRVLSQAEQIATNQLKAKELIMVVVSQRHELIEYYERRGYRRTGKIEKYPVHLNVGRPILDGLKIEYLTKNA